MRAFVLVSSLAAASSSLAQGSWASIPNWPTSTTEAYAIHLCHLRPTNAAMGNTGRFLFWGCQVRACGHG